MTKRNLLLASLLLVLGLGIMAPCAWAQGGPYAGNGTVFNVTPSLFTLRPNSIGDAGGSVTLTVASFGTGIASSTIAGSEVFTFTFSKPIVGASGIASDTAAAVQFCNDSGLPAGLNGGAFCAKFSYAATGNTLTMTNGPTAIPGLEVGSYFTVWGLRFDTVGVPPGTFITSVAGAVLNQNYPLSFGMAGVTQIQTPVNIGQVGGFLNGGGRVMESFSTDGYATSKLTCFTATSSFFVINVAEQWSGSWTSLSDEKMLAPYAPTDTGLATNGSDISITISGIPLGVTVVPSISPDYAGTYGKTFPANPFDNQGTAVWGTVTPTSYTGGKANDSVTFDFPLTSTIRDEIEAAYFGFEVSTSAPIPLQSPPMVATVYLNPMTPTSIPLYPAFTYPENGLASEPSPLTVVDFVGCQTNLLFPYVTNYNSGSGALGNWDTGIVVANTSSDPYQYTNIFGTYLGAIPTAGTCTFYVYGATTGSLTPTTDAAPVTTFTTPPVYTGGVDSFLLSSTSAKGLPAGYAIASCNFLNGTGYALIADNANGLGNWGVMGNYLAYVIPNPYVEPRWIDSIFGEFAISPWAYVNSAIFTPAHSAASSKTPKLRSPR